MAEITLTAFAQKLGIDRRAVEKARDDGRIGDAIRQNDRGFWVLEYEKALKNWLANVNPMYNGGKVHNALTKALNEFESTANPSTAIRPAARKAEPEPPQEDGKRSIAELRRLQMEVKLQSEALKLRERKGELVDKQKVYNALFAAGQEVRTALTVIPDRVIDTILAARDRNEAHNILTTAIHEALRSLADIGNREIIK